MSEASVTMVAPPTVPPPSPPPPPPPILTQQQLGLPVDNDDSAKWVKACKRGEYWRRDNDSLNIWAMAGVRWVAVCSMIAAMHAASSGVGGGCQERAKAQKSS